MTKKIISGCLILLIVLSLVSSVSAITASIGNAKMVLREVNGEPIKVGDTIEKYILVKNVNDVSVDIELFASGDLEKDINIKDKKFTLEPNTEKKAYFTIKVKEEGTTETKINVQFAPTGGGNGVGLSSTVIIIAGQGNGLVDSLFGNDEDDSNEDLPGVNVGTGKVINEDNKTDKISKTTLAFFITGLIFVIFIIVLIYANNKLKSKREKIKQKKSIKK